MELLVNSPDIFGGGEFLILFGGFVHKKLKKAIKKVGKLGQKVIDVHKKVAKKLEQTFRPVLKLGVVAAASYYGGPQAGQIAYGAAFKNKGEVEGVPYTEYSPHGGVDPTSVMDAVYPTAYPGFTSGYGGGYAGGGGFLGGGGGEEAPPQAAGIPPWMLIVGIGAAGILLLVIIMRR